MHQSHAPGFLHPSDVAHSTDLHQDPKEQGRGWQLRSGAGGPASMLYSSVVYIL